MKREKSGVFLLAFLLWPLLAWAQATPEQAAEYFQAKDWERAASAYAAISAEAPENGQAWFRLGYARHYQEDFDGAAAAWEKAEALGVLPQFTRYNLAAAHARLGHADEAFGWLQKALDAGFGNAAGMKADEDFASLRDDARFAASLEAADRNARPCEYSPQHRQFDFWVGEWEVHNSNGQFAGNNSIKKAEAGCVLVEHWTGRQGSSSGMSMNYFDPAGDQWVQVWIAPRYQIDIRGGLVEDAMVLEGHLINLDGTRAPFRGTWTPLPDGRVRQFFEQADSTGAWQPWFDGYYTRVEAEGEAPGGDERGDL